MTAYSGSLKKPSFSGIKRGTVINNVDPSGDGSVAVIIHELMDSHNPEDEITSPELKKSLNKEALENTEHNTYDDDIKEVNFFWARQCQLVDSSPREKTVTAKINKVSSNATSGTHQEANIGTTLTDPKTAYRSNTGRYKIPRVGTEVFLFFENGDPQKLFYFPFGPSLEGQVTPMDMVEEEAFKDSPEKKVNIDVLSELCNGNVLYMNGNPEENNLAIKFSNGHRFKIQYNPTASSILIDTERGHKIKVVDRSSSDGKNNPYDANNEDGVEGGSFIKIETERNHQILLDDNGGNEKILVKTEKGHTMRMDDTNDTLSIHTQNNTTSLVMKNGVQLLTKTRAIRHDYCSNYSDFESSGSMVIHSPIVNIN